MRIFAATPLSRPLTLKVPDLNDYMTTQEAAKTLGFHVIYVRRMVREGKLHGAKVGQFGL